MTLMKASKIYLCYWVYFSVHLPKQLLAYTLHFSRNRNFIHLLRFYDL